MKLSKQFMQTNLKWGYLYWQPISLNHPQQGTDGLSAGIACKGNRRGKGLRSCLPSPMPAQLWDDYRLVLVYVFDSVVILCTCETDPAFHETSFFKDHLPTIFGYQEPGFQHWTWSPFLTELSGKGHSRKQKQPADVGLEIGKTFRTNIWRVIFTCLFLTFVSTGHLPLCVGTRPGPGGKSWIQICPLPAVLTLDKLSKLLEVSVNSWTRLPTPPWQCYCDI